MTKPASEQITDEVGAWPGIEVDTGELGEVAFKVSGREIGHVHGESVAHFSFPRATSGSAPRRRAHRPAPGLPRLARPGAAEIHGDEDVRDVIELFRFNYDRVVARRGLPVDTDSVVAVSQGRSSGTRTRLGFSPMPTGHTMVSSRGGGPAVHPPGPATCGRSARSPGRGRRCRPGMWRSGRDRPARARRRGGHHGPRCRPDDLPRLRRRPPRPDAGLVPSGVPPSCR